MAHLSRMCPVLVNRCSGVKDKHLLFTSSVMMNSSLCGLTLVVEDLREAAVHPQRRRPWPGHSPWPCGRSLRPAPGAERRPRWSR